MSRLFTETCITFVIRLVPIPVAAWSRAWVCGRSLAGIAGLNPTGGLDVSSCERCVLSVRDLCVGSPIQCGVSECDRDVQ